jgi:hypothetical protein
MVYQTDRNFPLSIQKWGCYFLSLIERLTTHFDLPFTHDIVLSAFNYAQDEGYIDEEVTLIYLQALCDYMVGSGRVTFYGKYVPSYWCLDNEFEIVVYHKDGASFSHYCSGNGRGIVLYDPFSENGSDSVRNGQLIGKRIYKIL